MNDDTSLMIPKAEEVLDQMPSAEAEEMTRSNTSLRAIIVLLLAGLLLNSLLLRTQHISDVSFWFDEACSWKISTQPFPDMMEAVSNDVHPPLYYALLSWVRMTIGDSVEILRGVSVLFGVATVFATWWLLRIAGEDRLGKISSPLIALIVMPVLGALLISISPFQVDLSHQARPYTIGSFLSVMAAGFALQVTQNSSRCLSWVGFAWCCAILSFTHYFCLFTLAGIFLFLASQLAIIWWKSGMSREFWALLGGSLFSAWVCQLLWIFWWPSFLHQNLRGTQQAWMKPLDWDLLSQVCWKAISGGQIPQDLHAWDFLGPVIWLLVGVSTMLLWGRPGRLIGMCALAPPLIVSLYGLLVRNIMDVRYLAFGHLFFLICCAMLVMKLRFRILQITAGILMVAWSTTWLVELSNRREMLAENSGLRQAGEYIASRRTDDEPVFVSHLFGYLSIYRYLSPSNFVYLSYHGNHRSGIGSASLRERDYQDADQKLKERPPRLWTVDIPNLNGRFYADVLPNEYRLASQERFVERNFFVLELIVSEYVLKDVASLHPNKSPEGHPRESDPPSTPFQYSGSNTL